MINMQTLKHGTSCNCSYCGHRVVKAHRSVVRDGKTVRGNSRRQSAVINLYLDACTVANIKRDQDYFPVFGLGKHVRLRLPINGAAFGLGD